MVHFSQDLLISFVVKNGLIHIKKIGTITMKSKNCVIARQEEIP